MRRRARGVTLIEVLVTIVILSIGLLGVAALQTRLQLAQAESYYRSQAVLMLQDMVARINANRSDALDYVTAAPLGTGSALRDCGALDGAPRDLCEWNNALLGAAEVAADGRQAGGMIDARGCIASLASSMPRELVVAVTWQGLAPTVAPASTACGAGLYGDERTRRALVAHVTIGCLQNDPGSGRCLTP